MAYTCSSQADTGTSLLTDRGQPCCACWWSGRQKTEVVTLSFFICFAGAVGTDKHRSSRCVGNRVGEVAAWQQQER